MIMAAPSGQVYFHTLPTSISMPFAARLSEISSWKIQPNPKGRAIYGAFRPKARAQAAREADRILAQARETISQEKEAAMRDLRREVASLSLTIAESILRKDLSSDASQRELAGKLLDEMGKISLKS